MRHGIVEGEPGIFPAPIARLFQAIGRLFGRRPGGSHDPDPRQGPPPSPDDADVADVSTLDPKPPDDAGR